MLNCAHNSLNNAIPQLKLTKYKLETFRQKIFGLKSEEIEVQSSLAEKLVNLSSLNQF